MVSGPIPTFAFPRIPSQQSLFAKATLWHSEAEIKGRVAAQGEGKRELPRETSPDVPRIFGKASATQAVNEKNG
jgi:hypothetical protein